MSLAERTLKHLFLHPVEFIDRLGGIRLRRYQIAPVLAIARSIRQNLGHTIIVEFARQGGKNEIQAQIETYLLAAYMLSGLEMVIVSPTFKPQTENAMRRLERTLAANWLTEGIYKKRSGYIFQIGQCLAAFFSAQLTANVVGATASLLLLVDEAQDTSIVKFDKDFDPMRASTNATAAFFGTAWTSDTLLEREKKVALEAEKQDGIQRVFVVDAKKIAKEVPAYGLHVKKVIAKLGRQHPIVKTQYFLEVIDAIGGMFPPARRALARGTHAPYDVPECNQLYAITIDVAGEDEEAEGDLLRAAKPRKNSTALTIAEIDLSTLDDLMLTAPTYRIVKRHYWTGRNHVSLYGEIAAICELWQPVFVLVDATGIGEPLYSYLAKRLARMEVIGLKFTAQVKSNLGYRVLAAIDSGRLKNFADKNNRDALSGLFFKEMEYCRYEIKPGPQKHMAWGVPDGQFDQNGEAVHDDLIIGASMFTELDGAVWPSTGGGEAVIIQGVDPLTEIDKGSF